MSRDLEKKFRNITIELYEDNEKHLEILKDLELYEYLAIKHDLDIKEETGEIKKTHYHVILFFGSPRTLKSVINELGIEFNLIQGLRSTNIFIRYLLHLDAPEKHQYPKEQIFGNRLDLVDKALKSRDVDNAEDLTSILNYIKDNKNISLANVLKYCVEYNLLSAYRMYSYTIIQIVRSNQ